MFLFYDEMKSNNVPLSARPILFSFSLPCALKRYAFLLYLEVHDSSPSLCLEHARSFSSRRSRRSSTLSRGAIFFLRCTDGSVRPIPITTNVLEVTNTSSLAGCGTVAYVAYVARNRGRCLVVNVCFSNERKCKSPIEESKRIRWMVFTMDNGLSRTFTSFV
jgi:hypothetical protein